MTDRRKALGLGLAASALALSGRGKARAADALTIDAGGVKIDKSLTVGSAAAGGDVSVYGALTMNDKDIRLRSDEFHGLGFRNDFETIPLNGPVLWGYLGGALATQKTMALSWKAADVSVHGKLTVSGDAVLKKNLTVDGSDGAKSVRVSPTTDGANLLDVQAAARTKEYGGDHPTGLALYVTANGSGADGLAEFRHSNGSQGIGIGYSTIYAAGAYADQDLILKARGTGRVKIIGTLEAKDFAADANPLRNRMYPEAPKVYQDVFDALNERAIEKIGNPSYDDASWRQSLWNDRHMIRFGGNNEADGNGAKVTIPAGYDTVWVRVLGDRWNVILAYFTDGVQLGYWTGGLRSANSYAPDGTLADGYDVQHQWVPIPARRSGQLALISKPNTNADFWISGLAFSKNPWGHAAQSAFGYYKAVNGGDTTGWQNDNFGSDSTAKIDKQTKLVLKVPVVPSGRDKLLYLIEHNSDWNGAMHTGITVGGRPIERFMATYDNPFSRHWNSKSYERYIATRIPKDYVPADARHLDVIIDMTRQNREMNFREIGTHDLAVPWP